MMAVFNRSKLPGRIAHHKHCVPSEGYIQERGPHGQRYHGTLIDDDRIFLLFAFAAHKPMEHVKNGVSWTLSTIEIGHCYVG